MNDDFYDLIQLPTGEHIYVGQGDKEVVVDGVLYVRTAGTGRAGTPEAPSRHPSHATRQNPTGQDI